MKVGGLQDPEYILRSFYLPIMENQMEKNIENEMETVKGYMCIYIPLVYCGLFPIPHVPLRHLEPPESPEYDDRVQNMDA